MDATAAVLESSTKLPVYKNFYVILIKVLEVRDKVVEFSQ